MSRCKHGLSLCKLCIAPAAREIEASKAGMYKLANVTRYDGLHSPLVKLMADKPKRDPKNPIPSVAPRMDKVSDRRTKNTPKPHDWRDVIDRACFKFVKNTRAPK